MFRGIIPFILSLIGLPIVLFISTKPLFEWQISKIVTDFPSTYEVRSSPSPWKAWIGDSLDDKFYVFQKINVSENGEACSTRDLNFIVKRSQSDELLERLSLVLHLNGDIIYWVIWWIWIEIALSLAYISWFTVWHEHRPVYDAVTPTVLAIIYFCFITLPMIKLMGPRIGHLFDGSVNCHGTIMFNAKLLNVYHSVPILLFIGIFAELAALVIMVCQIAVTVRVSKLAVG